MSYSHNSTFQLRRFAIVYPAQLFLAVAAIALSMVLSRHGFTGYDVSPMVDAGWRVYRGQIPSVDFIVTFPPSLYMAVALGFHFFGVTWAAIAKTECVLYLTIVVLSLRLTSLLKTAFGTSTALWMSWTAFVGQTVLLLSINYPWHASMAQSFAVYAVLACAALCELSPANRFSRMEALLHLTLADALLLLSKPNTAWLAVVLTIYICWRSGRGVEKLVQFAASIVLAVLALARVHTTFFSVFRSYAGLTGRLIPKGFTHGILTSVDPHFGLASLVVYAVLAPLATVLAIDLWRRENTDWQDPKVALALGAIVIAIIGMGTNFDFKLTDTPLFLLGAAILAQGSSRHLLRVRLTIVATCIMLFALYVARTRYRMNWPILPCPIVQLDDPFLGRLKACSEIRTELTEVDDALAKHRGQKVFLGLALEFLYAGRGVDAPTGLPDWWDPGTSYSLKDSDRIARAWQAEKFDFFILRNAEPRFFPSAVQKSMEQDYHLLHRGEIVSIYERTEH